MITLKTSREILLMREAGRITGNALREAGRALEPGMTTRELDTVIRRYIEAQGAKPSFLGLYGFKGSACISINHQVIHGIPSKDVVIRSGDIVSVDVGACKDGYHGDSAYTFACGDITPAAQRLLDTTRESLYLGIKQAVKGNRIGDIGHAIQKYVEARGYSVVREYTGHGVGASVHEDPSVPNFGTPHRGYRLTPGMVIAIEPMINAGTAGIRQLGDGWTVVTADGELSAHFEHTVAVTADGPVILTMPDPL